MKKGFTIEEAEKVATQLGIDFASVPFDSEQFRMGLDVELEHGRRDPETNVTNDDPVATGKIAWAHLKERPDYYDALAIMEKSKSVNPESEQPKTVQLRSVGSAQQERCRVKEHPQYIKVHGHMYKLEEDLPKRISVRGTVYELSEPAADAPAYIKIAGVLFQKIEAQEKKKAPKKKKGKWSSLPKGWTKKSAESFWESIGGSVTKCRRKLKTAPEIDDTGKFCASLKDLIEGTAWRHEPKKKKSKKKSAGMPHPKMIKVGGILYQLDE